MARPDRGAVRAIMAKDVRAVSRSKAVVIPMLAVPALLLVVLPTVTAWLAAKNPDVDIERMLRIVPSGLGDPILALPPSERLVTLVNGYMLAPMLLIVPLMVSAVLAADAFAGEKERKTMESLLLLPVSDRDLFIAKVLGAFVPAVAVTWAGFALFTLVTDVAAWPALSRPLLPTWKWVLLIGWVAPAVAAVGLGVMVRISARARTSQEANQLGGAVILPLIFLAVGQATALLVVPPAVTFSIGLLLWVAAFILGHRGAARFTRNALSTQL